MTLHTDILNIIFLHSSTKDIHTWKTLVDNSVFLQRQYEDLYEACCEGNIKCVKFLILHPNWIHRVDQVSKSYDFDRALRCATMTGHLEIVKFLVERGANTLTVYDYVIDYAIENGYIDIISYFLDRKSIKIDYALQCAAQYGKLDIVYLLVERGANISSNDEQVLRHFVFYPIKFEDKIEKYLSRKPNHIDLFKILIEKKQSLPLVTSSRGENMDIDYTLQWVIKTWKEERRRTNRFFVIAILEIIKFLIERGANRCIVETEINDLDEAVEEAVKKLKDKQTAMEELKSCFI